MSQDHTGRWVCLLFTERRSTPPSSVYLNPACVCHWEEASHSRGDATIWTTACHPPSGEGHIWFGGYPFTESTTVVLQRVLCNLSVQEADASGGASCLSQGSLSTSHSASWGPFRAGGWRWGASVLQNHRESSVCKQHNSVKSWLLKAAALSPLSLVDLGAFQRQNVDVCWGERCRHPRLRGPPTSWKDTCWLWPVNMCFLSISRCHGLHTWGNLWRDGSAASSYYTHNIYF